MLTCTPAHCYSPFIAFLLSAFSPYFGPCSLWFLIVLISFSLSNPLASFSSPPIFSSPCISQRLPTLVITLLSHHVDITVPTLIPSLYLILFALSRTHSFLFPPFVGPHCLIPSFFLSALVLPLRAALKRHACGVVLHVNRIIGYGARNAGENITDCHQWN